MVALFLKTILPLNNRTLFVYVLFKVSFALVNDSTTTEGFLVYLHSSDQWTILNISPHSRASLDHCFCSPLCLCWEFPLPSAISACCLVSLPLRYVCDLLLPVTSVLCLLLYWEMAKMSPKVLFTLYHFPLYLWDHFLCLCLRLLIPSTWGSTRVKLEDTPKFTPWWIGFNDACSTGSHMKDMTVSQNAFHAWQVYSSWQS